MTALSWLVRGICPVCGEPARRGRRTCGDPKCIREDCGSPQPASRLRLWAMIVIGSAIMLLLIWRDL